MKLLSKQTFKKNRVASKSKRKASQTRELASYILNQTEDFYLRLSRYGLMLDLPIAKGGQLFRLQQTKFVEKLAAGRAECTSSDVQELMNRVEAVLHEMRGGVTPYVLAPVLNVEEALGDMRKEAQGRPV